MKKIASIIITLFIAFNVSACNDEQSNAKSNSENLDEQETIEVYYFHYSHRCKTCVAVEEETVKALEELYPEKMKTGEIVFKSIDMDEKTGEELAKNMKISGQTLIFIQGDERTNMTNDGFMYAATNPNKLKKKIKITVEEMLK